MKKCIVFDVDRTLVDSFLPEMLSLREAIENVTDRHITESEMRKITSLTTSEFFNYLNFSNDEIKKINKEWEKTFSNYQTKCFPNIKDVIKKISEDYVICIITSRTLEEFHELDDELNDVIDCFKIVITSDLINNPKPSRDSIDYLCDELQLVPEELIYIGDSIIDKAFSKNCNIDFIPACWENHELENEDNACFTSEEIINKIDLLNKKT